MNDEKKSWLDRAGAVHLWKTIEAMLGTKVDKIEGFGLSSNDYTTEEKEKLATLADPDVATTENNGLMSSADKAKLDGIEAGANNYTHPAYEAKQAGLYRISVDNTGHVATADKMTSEELAAEGVSPADHTHDLSELVDTLEASADAVEDADTVMVGATVTSNGSATTKYTRKPLATLWNWIKAKADTLYAAVGHTHNYAGSTEPGGDALTTLTVRDYNNQNNTIQIGWSGSDLSGDNLAYIAGYTPDQKIHTCSKDGVQNYIGLNNYLPLIGGTMSGALNFANNTWNLVGDDAYIGDHDIGGSFCIIGANDTTRLALVNKDNQGDYALVEYGGGNLNFNKKLGADITGNANTASYILNQGNQTAINSPLDVKGLSVYKVYDNGYPTTYGNVLSIGGDGDGQILAGWSGSNNGIERLYYRNRRDVCNTWSDWRAVAFTSDCDPLSSYPVGSIYMSTSSTSPASIFGGSWQSIASERVLMGVSSSHGAGSTVDAGLPNISSGSDAALDIQGSWGAPACRAPFAQTWRGNSELSTSTWSSTPKIISARFDASLCNSIYGRSSTVQPAAYYVYMWRRTG